MNSFSLEHFAQAFWKKVKRTKNDDDCWMWEGIITSRDKIGVFTFQYQTHSAHRTAYQLEYGVIPKESQVFHRCKNKLCCNPRHLYPAILILKRVCAISAIARYIKNH